MLPIKSTKSKPLVYENGFEYRFDRLSSDGSKAFWRCIRRDVLCKARAIGDTGSSVIVFNDKLSKHNHVPQHAKEKVRERMTQVKETASKNLRKTTREIVDEANHQLTGDALNLMPKSNSIQRVINRVRFVHGNEDVNCNDPKDIVFYQELLEFGQGSILLHDSRLAEPNSDIYFIFGSTEALERLNTYKHWSADGTFKVSPHCFQQLYTVNVLIEHSALPCVYILTQRRSTATYERIFTTLKSLMGNATDPVSFITDFEKGAQQAVSSVWPTTTIRSCLFHLSQSVYRHVSTLGLSDLYGNDRVKKSVRSLAALSFLMYGDISVGFEIIRNDIEASFPRLTPLFDYFHRTYIGSHHSAALFPPIIWSCHDTVGTHLGRTNNGIEGWHHAFRGRFNQDHPSLSSLIEAIKTEELSVITRIARYTMNPKEGISVKKRSVKYRIVDELIEEYVSDYDQLAPTSQNLLQHLSVLQNCLSKYKM